LAVAAVALVGGLASASDTVEVSGSSTRYLTAIEVPVAGQPTRLVLTGAALRKKTIFSVYTVASYVQQGTAARNAEQLVSAEAVKVLHLVMERDVDGKDMAEAIRTGIRLNHPANAFGTELSKVDQWLQARNLRKGQHVILTAIPKGGLRCQVTGTTDLVVDNPMFARAVWEIYLGRNNLGEPIKTALVARL
jgi:hypothetical protein